MLGVRKLRRGREIRFSSSRAYRVFWSEPRSWKTKDYPYWFFARYSDGTWTFQSMRFEIWKRSF